MIKYYRQRIIEYKSKFSFSFKSPEEYESFEEFKEDAKNSGYAISFQPISASKIDELVEKGYLYLFQIYNKDFSDKKQKPGTDNIHTMYWKALFDERNLKDIIFKLSGEAEVFFRKSSIEDTTETHPANEPIKCRRNESKSNTFAYSLVKDKRFRYDQYSLHTSIVINYKAAKCPNINSKINQFIRKADNLHIIGIDRGERNLIYISVIDMNGHIVEQRSLNVISSVCKDSELSMKTDYQNLLDNREKDNDKAQKSWQTVEKIKDLKAGYLSQVIHELVQLMVRYNAIICLEDLNSGFMRGRQKVDKSVYQQFEQKLIKKLQYLIDKREGYDQPLGVLHGIQLANSNVSFKGSQNGAIFYIPAWCTSKIDPVTGFVNLFSSKELRFENTEKTQKFFSLFDSIAYNQEKDYFEFAFDYGKFNGNAEGTRTKWTVCSYGDRIKTFRDSDKNNQWNTKNISLTNELKKLFQENGIVPEGDLKSKIMAMTPKKAFFEELLYLFRMILQMRNSIPNSTDSKDDYLISPVCGANGIFFDSRKADRTLLPCDADANGAYNIARKGLWVVQKIRENAEAGDKIPAMSKKDWLNFVQK